MKPLWTFVIVIVLTAPALGQTQAPAPVNPANVNLPAISPFQALANVLRNPEAPPQQPQRQVTSEPLQLPTAIPPFNPAANTNAR